MSPAGRSARRARERQRARERKKEKEAQRLFSSLSLFCFPLFLFMCVRMRVCVCVCVRVCACVCVTCSGPLLATAAPLGFACKALAVSVLARPCPAALRLGPSSPLLPTHRQAVLHGYPAQRVVRLDRVQHVHVSRGVADGPARGAELKRRRRPAPPLKPDASLVRSLARAARAWRGGERGAGRVVREGFGLRPAAKNERQRWSRSGAMHKRSSRSRARAAERRAGRAATAHGRHTRLGCFRALGSAEQRERERERESNSEPARKQRTVQRDGVGRERERAVDERAKEDKRERDREQGRPHSRRHSSSRRRRRERDTHTHTHTRR